MPIANNIKLTRRARTWSVILALSMFQLFPVAARATDLDFTKLVGLFNGPLRNRGIGGEVENGSSGRPAKNMDKALPLEVTVSRLMPTVIAAADDDLTVDIMLRNIGKDPILIPASRNDLEVLRSGNQDQRYLSVDLVLTGRESRQSVIMCIGLAVGSTSVRDSTVTLWPNQTMNVHGAGSVWTWAQRGFPAGLVDIKARVTLEELEENRVYMKSRSVASSSSETTIVWRR